jgi:nucleoside 2-deoxyribosyltransferase
MTKIYLAGPMDFVSQEHQMGWRERVKLMSSGLEFFDPTRRPHDCGMTNQEIFDSDLKDIEDSDVVLAEVNESGIPVFGTTCEIFYASHVLKKPVYGWYNKQRKQGKRIFQDVLLEREFSSLEDAIRFLMETYV